MQSVFESPWLFLTIAGVALVVVSVVRQDRPEWGYWLLLVPLVIAGLAFMLDAAVTTDTEAINEIIDTSKQAAVNNDLQAIMGSISPNYTDKSHRSKSAFEKKAQQTLNSASIKKIKTQSHLLAIDANSAQSELNVVVHFNNDSRYKATGSLVFVGIKLNYEKIGKKWLINSAEVVSLNNQPWSW